MTATSRSNIGLAAERIKSAIGMEDVLRLYGCDTPPARRIACPIHNGHDKNFSYRDRTFQCFVCGASGSVVDFAMAMEGLSFKDAVKRLDSAFKLGFTDERTDPAALTKWRQEKERQAAEKERRHRLIMRACDEHRRLWKATLFKAPQTPEDMDNLDPEFVEACHRLPALEYWLDTHDVNDDTCWKKKVKTSEKK